MIPREWLDQADERLTGKVTVTPLTYDPELKIYLKWENRQQTGSFKIRGAANKLLSLQTWERKNGLVTASAGNHGLGVALAAKQTGDPVLVFASSHASPLKLEKIRKLGAQLKLVEGGYSEAERTAIAYAADHQAAWISPYNDIQVICGQSSLASEIIRQAEGYALRAVIVPGGGGGLLAGIGARASGSMKVIGVSSDASPYLHQLFHTGSQEGIIEYDSLADGLAGAVEPGSITIPLVREYTHEFHLVTETAVAHAIAYAWFKYHEVIEGSAAVGLAAVLEGKIRDYPAVVIISGGNIQPDLHGKIWNEWKDQWA